MNSYILIILADVFLAAMFACQKVYQKKAGTGVYSSLFYSSVLGLFMAAIFFVINGFKCNITPYSLVCATVFTTLVFVYIIIGFKILKNGDMSLYTLFLMTGGMTVPYIWGVVFLDEKLTLLRIFGILLIITAIVISNISGRRSNKKQILLCIAVFFLNGFVSVVSKMHQINDMYERVGEIDFIILASIVKFILCSIALFFVKNKNVDSVDFKLKSVVIIIFIAAVVDGISCFCQLVGAKDIPATVLYPLVSGGSVILSSLTGRIVFREKLTVIGWTGIAVCFLGTCLFL